MHRRGFCEALATATAAILSPGCAALIGRRCLASEIVVDTTRRIVRCGAWRAECVLSRRGFGGRPGSKRTPLGDLTIIAKEARHRFGPILRIGGVSRDGYRQDGRGVLFHRKFGPGTSGCIALDPADVRWLFEHVAVGARVSII